MGSACVAWSHSATCSASIGPCSQSPRAPENLGLAAIEMIAYTTEYSNVTNSEPPAKGITVQVGRCEGTRMKIVERLASIIHNLQLEVSLFDTQNTGDIADLTTHLLNW